MEQNKILTIIIPTYNMEKYLRKCLDSLIVSDENMQLLEVLVINDGSKDSSSLIAHEYESRFPQSFRVIDKENGNYGSCINRGLKEATGKYVKVLDADDSFDRNVLDDFLHFLSKSEADLVFCGFVYVDENDTRLSEYDFNLPIGRYFSLEEVPPPMIVYLAHFTITYKRKLFSIFDYRQTEGVSYSDDEWVLKPMMWVDKVQYFPAILYKYLRGREGQTFDPKVLRKSLANRITVAKEMVSFCAQYISKCHSSNVFYVKEKLTKRVWDIYATYLIKYYSNDNYKVVADFDDFVKQESPELYESLNSVVNGYGWHYIKQWRKRNHSYYSPAIAIIRYKRRIKRIVEKEEVLIDYLPSDLKRISVS